MSKVICIKVIYASLFNQSTSKQPWFKLKTNILYRISTSVMVEIETLYISIFFYVGKKNNDNNK